VNVLIVTPLQEESDFFLQFCVQQGFQPQRAAVGRLPVVLLPQLGITLARGGTGKAQFALQTQHLLDAGANWELVVCVGAAGSLTNEVSVGDVVVATATVEHDFRNRFSTRPMPRFDGARGILDGLRNVAPRSDTFRVHFGPIASGDEDVVDEPRRKTLQEATGAFAVAWEGAGGARACQFSDVPYVEIRGITDAADPEAPADFEVNLEVAMGNVAAALLEWIVTSPGLPQ
jgi:adenosylhomocysteine nucleosidase